MPVLNLVNESDSPRTVVDLYNGACELIDTSWTPVFTQKEEVVASTIPLYISSSAVATLEQIDELLFKAEQVYRDRFHNYDIWFEFQPQGGQLVRYKVVGGYWKFRRATGQNSLLEDDRCSIDLTLEMISRAEATSSTTVTQTLLQSHGANFELTSLVGTSNGRIYLTKVKDNDAFSNLNEIWMGIRPEYYGYGTGGGPVFTGNFSGLIAFGDDTGLSSWTDSIGGQVVRTTFATNSGLAYRFTFTGPQLGGGPKREDSGKYTMLIRMTGSDAVSVFGVQMRAGLEATALAGGHQPYPEIEFSNGSWLIVPVATYLDPPGGFISDMNAGQTMEFEIWAERISGTGSLYFDTWTAIPATHSVHVKNINKGELHVVSEADGVYRVWSMQDFSAAQSSMASDMVNWRLPIGKCQVVVAAQRDGIHVSTDKVDVTMEYLPRWRGLRL